MDDIEKGAYTEYLCGYCGNIMMVSEISLKRPVQTGAEDRDLQDKYLFACCASCQMVAAYRNEQSVYVFVAESEDGGNLYGYCHSAMSVAILDENPTLPSLANIREGITDQRWFVMKDSSILKGERI